MADLPAELKALPLEHIVGSPLQAAIKAQALAARTTVDFIKDVGLQPDKSGSGQLVANTVSFKFDRTLEELQQLPGTTTPIKNFRIIPSKLEVPLLSIVPIPFIRITDMTIDFEYKIRDIETSEHQDELNVSAKVEAKYWFIKAEVSGSYTNKNTNKRETDRSTTLRITVNAAQDNIPEGLARVLDMMHEQLKVVPLSNGTALPAPTARIDSVSPLAMQAGAAKTTFNFIGTGLKGATKATVIDATTQQDDLTFTIANLTMAATPDDDKKGTVDLTSTANTPTGDKILRIDTPQGQASVRLAIYK